MRIALVLMLALVANASVVAQTATHASTTLTVDGAVAQALVLKVADLERLPSRQVEYVPRAGMEGKDPGPVRHYTGTLLLDVLAAAKPVEAKPRDLRRSYVLAAGSDGYEVVFSWAELFVSPTGDNVFVIYKRDGEPIADDEGAIAMVVLTDTRPVRHVKWLQRVTLRAG